MDRLEGWACANFVKLNKTKCKVLHLGQGNPKSKYGLDGEWIENSLEEKDLGVLGCDPALCSCCPESQLCPAQHQKLLDQHSERGDSAPVSSSGVPNTGAT